MWLFFGAWGIGAGCGPTIAPGATLAERAAETAELVRANFEGEELAAAIWLRAGSARDPSGREGSAWLAAHARARGTGAHPVTVDVDVDWARYEVRCPAQADIACVNALVEAVFAPAEAGALAAARADALTWLAAPDAEGLGRAALDMRLFAGHPYGHATRGRISVLPLLELPEIERFRAAHELRSTARAGIAGKWSPEAEAALAAGLARLPARPEQGWPLQKPERPGPSAPWEVVAASGVGGAFGGRALLLPPEDPAWPSLLIALAAETGQVPEAPGWFGAAPREHAHIAVWAAKSADWPPPVPSEAALRAARAALAERARPTDPIEALRAALTGGGDASGRLSAASSAEIAAAIAAHLAADSARWVQVHTPPAADSPPAVEEDTTPDVREHMAPVATAGLTGKELFQ